MPHTGDPLAECKDKIEPFINSLCARFQEIFTPLQDLSIDEMVVGYKGRWKFLQFNAAKPDKHLIKSFGLVDSVTGYVLNILTYFGHNTSYNPECDLGSGTAMKVFDTLLANVGRGHHVSIMDRLYATPILIDHMTNRSQYYTGTVQINRKHFHLELKTQHLVHMVP
ncbi:PiggyBac transposable element-derived protein 4 [Plakobranchus ocellatus]|uniref:PiggyBac transposable element-derived protein 4 n=1 Tax=Plakobranchus ocellatus TaxID=259542 RepID=A0AAV3Z898_9GAST|nr:PiggyBac transposable element-derived protein 4 [Plakobranchus ocellatus]